MPALSSVGPSLAIDMKNGPEYDISTSKVVYWSAKGRLWPLSVFWPRLFDGICGNDTYNRQLLNPSDETLSSLNDYKNCIVVQYTGLHKIVPKGLKIALPVSRNRAKRIANRASEVLVRERINYHRLAKIRITQECEEIKQKIEEIVNEEDFTSICAAVQRSNTRINGQLKGTKFAIAPTLDMILAAEMAAGKIQPPQAADEYLWMVRTAIEKAKPKQIRQNISKAEQRSLKEVMSDKNIKILPADKGNATARTFEIKSDFPSFEGETTIMIEREVFAKMKRQEEGTALNRERGEK
ncbi:hypothetical protein Trydic_g7014 [Trypoxylus dichotomus]